MAKWLFVVKLNFIANQSVPALAGQTIDVLDPSDGQVFEQIPRSQAADIDAAVQAALAYCAACSGQHITEHEIEQTLHRSEQKLSLARLGGGRGFALFQR